MGIYVRHGTWVSYETGSIIKKIESLVHDVEPSYHLIEVDLEKVFEDNSYVNRSFEYSQPLKKLRKLA
ncbi:MAG: hypothetical protein ACXADY_07435 [Candidatus Hodarchaeales archaeon]|jgi:hypothetical protein